MPESVEADQARPVRVFMSYRRADDRHFIGRLHDRLCLAFGEEQVFRDIDSIPPGTNFRQVILRTLDEVDVVVAVIGPQWARPVGADTSTADYVFLELIEALKHGKPVVPVLIEDTPIPSRADLPPDLDGLDDINAISVRADPAFRRDSDRLIEAVNAVVAEDRARIAREREAADKLAREAEAERAQREQVVQQLRADERAARARLAELEEVATRRQIELERDRLEAIEEQLRKAEPTDRDPVVPLAPPPRAPEVADVPFEAPPLVEPTGVAHSGEPQESTPSPGAPANIPRFELLIIAALVLGVVGLFLDRSVLISDSTYTFNEMGSKTQVDILVMLLTVATAVPLFLGKRPVEQRFVLAGIAISTFIFGLLQASATVRYGFDGYDEGSWYLLKVAQIACLVGAYVVLRNRSTGSISSPRRFRVPLTLIALGCGALLTAATNTAWSDVTRLIEDGVVPDRSPLLVWLLLIALPPIVVTVVLAVRGTYAAQVSLATIASLATLSYFAEAGSNTSEYTDNGSTWGLVGTVYALLAIVVWSVVTIRSRSAPTR